MFRCERCGSRYSSMHAAAIENCPRCLIRDRVSTPLSFKAFRLPNRAEGADTAAASADERERSISASSAL